MDARTPGRSTRPVVFLGPTMTRAEAAGILDAIYLPPAAQGSVVAAVAMLHPSAIVLIDGVFQGEPAVRHKELLWAMSRGFPLYGAASMGALRAAELAPYGMIGVGRIYRWYRRYACLPDDAVAVLHGPQELGSKPLTVSLVDLRLTIRAAARGGRIDTRTSAALESAAMAVNFRDRSLPAVIARAAAAGHAMPPGERERLAGVLRSSLVEQKKADAAAVLAKVRDVGAAVRPPICRPQFTPTRAFRRDLEDAGLALPAFAGNGQTEDHPADEAGEARS